MKVLLYAEGLKVIGVSGLGGNLTLLKLQIFANH